MTECNVQPQTGLRVPLIWPGPDLGCELRERDRCFIGQPELVSQVLRDDAHKLAHPESVRDRIVYDALDAPPGRTAPSAGVHASLRPYYKLGAGAASHPASAPAKSKAKAKAKTKTKARGGPKDHRSREQGGGGGSSGSNGNSGSENSGSGSGSSEYDTTLVFESRFEGGNLRRAVQVSEYEYDLILQPDSNTRGHTQWFYFSVRNARRRRRYKLNVINNEKCDSLYNKGMRPLLHSARQHARTGCGWTHAGESVLYYANHIRRPGPGRKGGRKRYLYTLTLALTPEHADDELHIAYALPYSYTQLQQDLAAWLPTQSLACSRPHPPSPAPSHLCGAIASARTNVAAGSGWVRRETLCHTLAGNRCELLTITDFTASEADIRRRRGVVLTCRVHPGESNASHMLRGTLRLLLGDSEEARGLRRRVVFKVIPMLNPDGVIHGNYRCNLAGDDLNRQWAKPCKIKHPTVWHAKRMIAAFHAEMSATGGVMLWCDLHGHSRRRDVFAYGCKGECERDALAAAACVVPGQDARGDVAPKPAASSPLTPSTPLPPPLPPQQGAGQAQVLPCARQLVQAQPVAARPPPPSPSPSPPAQHLFPFMLSQRCEVFSFEGSSFAVQKSKSSTARIVGFKELGIANTFTIEASFLGSSQGAGAGRHFSARDLESVGVGICHTVRDMLCTDSVARAKARMQSLGETLHVGHNLAGGDGDDDEDKDGGADDSEDVDGSASESLDSDVEAEAEVDADLDNDVAADTAKENAPDTQITCTASADTNALRLTRPPLDAVAAHNSAKERMRRPRPC